jgi:hypothetical protein
MSATLQPPSVEVSATNVAKLTLGLPLPLFARTSGDVQTVEFFVNQDSVGNGQLTSGAYRLNWVPSVAGLFTVAATATSSGGLSSTSAPVQVAIGALTTLTVEDSATNKLTFRFNPAAFMPTKVEWTATLDSGVWTQVTKQLFLGASGGDGYFSEWPDYKGIEESITFEETPTEEQRYFRIRAQGP